MKESLIELLKQIQAENDTTIDALGEKFNFVCLNSNLGRISKAVGLTIVPYLASYGVLTALAKSSLSTNYVPTALVGGSALIGVVSENLINRKNKNSQIANELPPFATGKERDETSIRIDIAIDKKAKINSILEKIIQKLMDSNSKSDVLGIDIDAETQAYVGWPDSKITNYIARLDSMLEDNAKTIDDYLNHIMLNKRYEEESSLLNFPNCATTAVVSFLAFIIPNVYMGLMLPSYQPSALEFFGPGVCVGAISFAFLAKMQKERKTALNKISEDAQVIPSDKSANLTLETELERIIVDSCIILAKRIALRQLLENNPSVQPDVLTQDKDASAYLLCDPNDSILRISQEEGIARKRSVKAKK